uniref:Uncharacterized protein n=1 Tax=Xenopus tropicalis TaxID=8364 RepID=A0A6I8RZ10_XENTR
MGKKEQEMRLAVIVANQVLLGRKVLPVRCKGINISATSAAINLCTSHSCIRQQETRLQATLGRLKVFDGIPPPHERRKRMVVPDDGAPEANTEVCFPWYEILCFWRGLSPGLCWANVTVLIQCNMESVGCTESIGCFVTAHYGASFCT